MDELCHLSKNTRICVHFECYICEYRMLNTTVQSYAHSIVRKLISYCDSKPYLCDKYLIYMSTLRELANVQTSIV